MWTGLIKRLERGGFTTENQVLKYKMKALLGTNDNSNQIAMKPLCNELKIGYIEFDDKWNVQEFLPKSNKMLKQTVSYCPSHNTMPEIRLNAQNNIFIELNDPQYAMPIPTAMDAEDGDISSQITTEGHVDISKLGHYKVKYSVVDSDGNMDKLYYHATVVNLGVAQINVDGSSNDWPITATTLYSRVKRGGSGHFTSSTEYIFKAIDTTNDLYFWANASKSYHYAGPKGGSFLDENWQVLIDSDNNGTTGYYGSDYLVENGILYKFSGRNLSDEWSWQAVDDQINFARGFTTRLPNQGALEFSLKKSLLENVSKKIKVKLIARNANWASTVSMPASVYTFKH